jgi:hypothetical protein
MNKTSFSRSTCAGLLGGAFLAAGLTAHGSNQALLDALVTNGYLTQEQAAQIAQQAPVQAAPKSRNVEELRIRGRIQGQFAYADGSGAGNYSTFEMRRVRLGVEGRMYRDYEFNVEANMLPNQFSMRSAFLSWTRFEEANVTFGYDKPRFGLEENMSSAAILTVERSLINERVKPGERTGLRVHGTSGIFYYYGGVYNHTANGGANPAGMDDYLYNLSGEFNLDRFVEQLSRLRLRADWLGAESSPAGYAFDDAFAFSIYTGMGPAELRAEYFLAKDFNGNDTSGFYVMPSYFVLPGKFELVGRYEQSRSDVADGLGHNRYANRVPGLLPAAGNRHNAYYFGANYYIKANDLKYMFGLEMAELEDTAAGTGSEAITASSAVRMQF